ncbi:MAG TPA: hypothetical protein VJ694_00335 [Patescibacteria group bacterium]|nr:hypothetical protein [Patescibacteria group bacterium]
MRADSVWRNVPKTSLAFLGALFCGLAAVLWLFSREFEPGAESPLSSIRRLRNVVIVQDQAAASGVVITYAALSSPSFIAVQPEGPERGRVLAVSRLLPEGEARNFRVPVEGGLPAGFYYAVLMRDDGDASFDPKRDVTVRDARGAAVITRFLVTDAPSR